MSKFKSGKNLSRHRCSGIRTSGYWKGYPCGASANYEKGGAWYCANHLTQDKELECDICGALLYNKQLHDYWEHSKREKIR